MVTPKRVKTSSFSVASVVLAVIDVRAFMLALSKPVGTSDINTVPLNSAPVAVSIPPKAVIRTADSSTPSGTIQKPSSSERISVRISPP